MMTTRLNRGYTLVELIVSVAIFAIVMLVASAAFLTLISLDRDARATNDVVTNLSYVIDTMERSIRTGTGYLDTSGGSQFTFTDTYGEDVTYRLVTSSERGAIEQCIGGTCMALTDPRVDIESLYFYSRGTAPGTEGDTTQPTVQIRVRGLITPDPESNPIEVVLEGAATQRLIDI